MKNNTRKIISLLLVFFVTFAVTSNAWATTTYKYGQRSDRGSRPFNRDSLPIDIEVDKDEGKNPIAKFVLKDKSFRNDIVRLVIGEQDGKGIFYNDRIFYDEEIVLDNLEYNKKYYLQLIVNNNNGDIIETYTGNFIIENKPSRQVEISNTEKTNYKKYTEVHENRDRDFSRDNDKDSINSSIYRASGYGSMEENESNDEFEDANIIEGRVYKVIGTIDSRRDEDEKNNEADDASEIDVEEGRREEIYGTIHHEDDVDWYEFEVDGYSDLDIELNNIPRDCNYDIKLYRKDGRYTDLIESSRRSGDKSEDIRETVEKGTYYVKIYGDGYDDFDVNDEYELEIRYRYNDDDSYYAPDGGVWVSDMTIRNGIVIGILV